MNNYVRATTMKFYSISLMLILLKSLLKPFHLYSARFRHRQSSFKELQFISDGDSNGVLYFAGTSFGEHQWVNPVLSKVSTSIYIMHLCLFNSLGEFFLVVNIFLNFVFQRITVTASSPTSRYTDPKVLVSRTYQVR